MLSAATGVAPASCRHVRGAKTAGETSAREIGETPALPASFGNERKRERRPAAKFAESAALEVQQIACEDCRFAFNYSAPRRPSRIAPQVTV
jgi:hypothetical protein